VLEFLPWGILFVFFVVVIGIFQSKTPGFGKYTTSTLIFTIVLFVASMAFFTDRLEWAPLANILFAALGFAGGLITNKAASKDSDS
jgi:uncharacterized membrane protein YhhN